MGLPTGVPILPRRNRRFLLNQLAPAGHAGRRCARSSSRSAATPAAVERLMGEEAFEKSWHGAGARAQDLRGYATMTFRVAPASSAQFSHGGADD